MKDQKSTVLFITDKRFIDYEVAGGVQICTHEFIEYLTKAGFNVEIFKAEPLITLPKKIKLKLGAEAYDLYTLDNQLASIINTINANNIKLVLFNQLNLAHNVVKIKGKVAADVKFLGLSHGNESGDYLHEITHNQKPSFLKTWRLGKMMAMEKQLFSDLLNGVIVISEQEAYIDQWLGANNILYLPRILKNDFINWAPTNRVVGFVGTLDHLPNSSGIDLLAKQLQLKGFDGVMKLVGGPEKNGYEFEEKYKFIHYCGALGNEQLIAEVSTWSVFINPVFWYARGSSTKLSQALNWGIPAITTPAGARGYDLCATTIVTVNNSPGAFAEITLKALGSATFLKELKQATTYNVINFNLEAWANKLSAYLNSL